MVVLSLGTNLGDRFGYMKLLEKKVSDIFRGSVVMSPLYETDPVGVDQSHPPYLNRIIAGEYIGTPEQLLAQTQFIENELGRTGKGKLAPRTADIDILLFDTLQLETPNLTIPHHALFERHFEIAGVKAVVPQMEIPSREMSFGEYRIPAHILEQTITELT